ncbi:MAG: hypothetical protein IPJ75_14565 [Ignavibacteriales bacterium]|nr:hypothetical protein [Ignavibacteriales bacterium]
MRKNIFLTLVAVIVCYGVIFPQKGVEVIMPTPISNVITEIVVLDKTTAWAAGNLGTVLRTTDAGLTWQTLRSGENLWINSIAAIDANRAWVTGPDEFLTSTTDGGKTWKDEKIGKIEFFSKVQFVDAQNGFVGGAAILTEDQAEGIFQLYATTDGGKTWKERNASLGFNPLEVEFTSVNTGFAIDKFEPITGKDKFLRTTDGGKTWEAVKEMANMFIQSMTFPDTKTGYIVVEEPLNTKENPTSNFRLFKTVDGGNSWKSTPFQDKPFTGEDKMPQYVYFKDSEHGWLIKSNQYVSPFGIELLKTVDGGKTWQKSFSDGEKALQLAAFFDNNTGVFLSGFWSDSPIVFRTTDGGKTYNQLIKGNDLHFHTFQVVDPQSIFALGENGVVKSTDGGKNWTEVVNAKGTFFDRIQFFNKKEAVATCFDDAGKVSIFSSTDGGTSWKDSKAEFADFPQKLVFIDLKTAFMLTMDDKTRKVLRSDDAGKTWKELLFDTSPSGQFSDLFFIDKNTGWMTGEAILPGAKKNGGMVSFIKKTTDGGASWSETYLNDQVFPNILNFLDQENGWYVSTINDTSLVLHKTSDGGKKWVSTILGPAYELYENIQFQDPMNGWLIKSYASPHSPSFIHRTKDGGKTWELYKTVNKIERLQFIDKNTIYGGGYSNLIKITVE